MEVYTIDRAGTLAEGTQVVLTNIDPHNIPNFSTAGFSSAQELDEHALHLFPEGLSRFGWSYLKTRHTYGNTQTGFNHDVSFLTEMNVEWIRRCFFANRPSRMTCVFACESLSAANELKAHFQTPNANVFRVEIDNYLKVDMNWLRFGTQNVQGSFLAHKYWQGDATQDPFWEFLLPLPVRVGPQIG